jgi:hypothetical protein
MKYLQLFENWLNEAEAAFDIKKPRLTPVLKILQKDLYSGDTRKLRWAILSMLSRSLQKNKDKFDKDSDTVSKGDDFELLKVEDAKITLWLNDSEECYVKMNAKKDAIIKALEWIGGEISGDDLKKSCIVTVLSEAGAGNIYYGKKEENISTKSSVLLIIPNKPKAPEELAINLSAVVVAQDKAKIVTLGQLCAYAASKFTDFTLLEKKDSGTKDALAKEILKGEEGGGGAKTA